MKKIIIFTALVVIIALIISSVGSCSVCSNESHRNLFNEDGTAVVDTTLTETDFFQIENPSRVHFYMEASGSMNGFLRGGVPTDFKTDVWEIINYYSNIAPTVSVLSTDGGVTKGIDLSVAEFQNPFNGGGFVSGLSTNLCQMIGTIIENTKAEKNEVAVFISDMEYDPVGAVAPKVLASVFATDIAKILTNFGYSACLVVATSNSIDKHGALQTPNRPYYYLILGKAECVAGVRNCISIMLDDKHHFVDNIETGFNYGKVPHKIVDYSGCTQVRNEDSFSGISDAGCSFVLGLELENYRWLLTTDSVLLKECLHFESQNGAQVVIDSISFDVQNIIDKQLQRDVMAKVHISVTQMPYDCDILTWNLDIPATNTSKLQHLFTDIPNSLNQTFSIKEFITGMFRESLVCKEGKDNYIHIAK